MTALVVAAALLAGALGALARYGITHAVARREPSVRLPWAVLIANVAGSLVAGLLITLPPEADLRLVLVGGFAGGLTTFSTWSVETVQLALDGRGRQAVLNILANLIAGGLAAALGALVGGLLGLG
jgi:CrcB protein